MNESADRGRLCAALELLVIFVLTVAFIWSIAHLEAIPFGGRDYVVFMQGIYRAQQGQLAHVDFYTPLGFLNFALPALLSKTGLPLYTSLVMALGLLSMALALMCYWIFRPVGLGLAFLLSVAVFSFAFGFRAFGDETLGYYTSYTIHLYYNRIGLGALLLCSLIFYASYLRKQGLTAVQQVALACSLFLCVYLKISYAVVLCLAWGIWVYFTPAARVWNSYRYLLPVLLISNALVLFFYGPELVADYFSDLRAMSQASAKIHKFGLIKNFPARLIHPLTYSWVIPSIFFLSYACVTLVCRYGLVERTWLQQHWKFFALFAFLAMIYFAGTNSGPLETSLLALPMLFMLLGLHLQAREESRHYRILRSVMWCTAIAAVYIRAEATYGSWSAMVFPRTAVYNIAENLGKISYTDKNFRRYVNSGKNVLADLAGRNDKSVLVFDLGDILTPVLHLRPPTGAALFFHHDMVWSNHCAASFRGLTSDVDIVMVPKQPLMPPETEALMLQYEAGLKSEFHLVQETEDWSRYERNVSLVRASKLLLPQSYCLR